MGRFDHLLGKELGTGTRSWTSFDALLYAVGVGAGSADPYDELRFTTENATEGKQQVLPTFMTRMGLQSDWMKDLGFPAKEWDGWPVGMVHGEQGVSLARPIPPEGTANLSQVIVGVFDKGSGALCVQEVRATLADTGEYLGSTRAGFFIRGQGGFGGPRAPADEAPWEQPDRAPDLIVSQTIPVNQSLIYRLNGDRNPHGTDPVLARKDGFERPIFYGLGTYGFAGRALLNGLCDGDASRFGGIYGRMSSPVHPGQTLRTHIWKTDHGALFRTMVDDRTVLDRGTFSWMG